MIGEGTDEEPFRPQIANAPFADGMGWAICAISSDNKWVVVAVDGDVTLRGHAMALSDAPLGKKADSVMQSLNVMHKDDLLANFIDQFIVRAAEPVSDISEEGVQ